MILPSQVFPFPVYPGLQVHVYFPGSVSAHVAYSLQSSCGVSHILIANSTNFQKSLFFKLFLHLTGETYMFFSQLNCQVDKQLILFIVVPSQVFPFPVYPGLQVQVYFPGSVSAHVANSLQSSRGVSHIVIADQNKFSINFQSYNYSSILLRRWDTVHDQIPSLQIDFTHEIVPVHVFPSPVYPELQVQVYLPGSVSRHVANSLQSSCGVPQIVIADGNNSNKMYLNMINHHKLPTAQLTVKLL